MSAELSARWVRRWVAVYTRGLPAEVRQDRRDEIEDDLWAQMHEAGTSGRTDRSLAGEIVIRLLFGIPADISWRVEQRGPAPKRVPSDLDSTTGIRFIALFAVLGGVGWVVWPIPQAVYGDAGWSENGVPWLLFFSVVLGTWALAAAMLGLVMAFQEWIRGGVAFLGVLGATVGAYSVFGLFGGIVVLLLGSAVLVWELGRVGVLSVRLSRAHVVTAIIWLVSIVLIFTNITTFNANPTAAAVAALFLLPYGFSWIAIGWSLRHGAPVLERPAEGTS